MFDSQAKAKHDTICTLCYRQIFKGGPVLKDSLMGFAHYDCAKKFEEGKAQMRDASINHEGPIG
jgi:hypothetical protein